MLPRLGGCRTPREGRGRRPASSHCLCAKGCKAPRVPLHLSNNSGGGSLCAPQKGGLATSPPWASPWDVPLLLTTGGTSDGFGVLVVAGHTGGPISKDLGVVTWLPLSTTCAPFFVSLFIYNLVWLFFFFSFIIIIPAEP